MRHRVTYEAQAAIELEALARSADRTFDLDIEVDDSTLRLPALITGLRGGLRAGVPKAELAAGFHEALAIATAKLVIGSCAASNIDIVGLTGGVFQNRLLQGRLAALLRRAGLEVLVHAKIPANDGGLALGQAAIGRAMALPAAEAGVG